MNSMTSAQTKATRSAKVITSYRSSKPQQGAALRTILLILLHVLLQQKMYMEMNFEVKTMDIIQFKVNNIKHTSMV